MSALLARLCNTVRRKICIVRMHFIDSDLEALEVHERALLEQRDRLLIARARARGNLASLDRPIPADGCHPFN